MYLSLIIFVATKKEEGMDPYRLYIKQTPFDGVSYDYSAPVVDTYTQWGIVCAESPYKRYGEPQNIASRVWFDDDGSDVYIPEYVTSKSYDAEFTFLCVGTESDVKGNVLAFHKYLLGKTGADGGASKGARLLLYDDFNGIGWKDVYLKSFSSEALVMDNGDDEVKLKFKMTFSVNDPVTPITRTVSHGHVTLIVGE